MELIQAFIYSLIEQEAYPLLVVWANAEEYNDTHYLIFFIVRSKMNRLDQVLQYQE